MTKRQTGGMQSNSERHVGGDWRAPASPGTLAATAALPGSKSLTNRALVLAALSQTPSRITGGLQARDTNLMVAALGDLGCRIESVTRIDGAVDWLVQPSGFVAADIDCGLAGTVMRFLPPLAALASGDSRFDGDPNARTRPMSSLLAALRQAGAVIEDGGAGTLPFTVRGSGSLAGGRVSADFSGSSQFVSALLLAGARFDKGIEVVHVGPPVPSLPHIEMTCAALGRAGVAVEAAAGAKRWIVAPGPIYAADVVIEPDLSNAAPFLAAALICGGTVTVPRWPQLSTQAGDQLPALLARMGATVHRAEAGLTVAGTGSIGPLVADLHDIGELTPVLAALCALADGESRLSGIAHIRGHETDRLAAIAAELTALGGDIEETSDGLIIRPATLRPGRWHTYADHRMAHAGAVLGLAVDGIELDDIRCTTKTMSDFDGLWAALLGAPAEQG